MTPNLAAKGLEMLTKQKSSSGPCHMEMLDLLKTKGKETIYREEGFAVMKEGDLDGAQRQQQEEASQQQ